MNFRMPGAFMQPVFYDRKSERMGDQHMYDLLEKGIIIKRQRKQKDRELTSMFQKPESKKRMQEIMSDQYKHEKMLMELYEKCTGRVFTETVQAPQIGTHIEIELEKRIDETYESISFFRKLSFCVEVPVFQQMLSEIITDEQINCMKMIDLKR